MSPEKDIFLKRVKQKPNIILRKEENCYLLVNRNNGKVLVTNNTGFEAWHLFKKLTLERTVQKLSHKYAVELRACQKEILNFVQKLLKNDMIELV